MRDLFLLISARRIIFFHDLGFPSPLDRASSMQAILDYYERLAPTYDRERFGNSYGRFVDARERALLRAWLRGRAPERVVEVGCGTGRLLDFAGTGVDASPAMLEQAREKWPDRRLVRADATATGLGDGEYDAAICFHLLMHLDAAACADVFREAARLVRRGGAFVCDVPSLPRRRLSARPPSGWHGDTAATLADVRRWAGAEWRLKRWRGVLSVPIHRVPKPLRPLLGGMDAAVGRMPLARWASYYVCELERL